MPFRPADETPLLRDGIASLPEMEEKCQPCASIATVDSRLLYRKPVKLHPGNIPGF